MAGTIGRFEVVRSLGKGGQGIVYLARDPHLDRHVAIKTLSTASGDIDTLLKEARIVSKLQHPNIVPLFDAGEHEGRPYLVYAYVEGKTLAQQLREEGVLSVTRAVQVLLGMLEAIGYAHAQGVVHLDIKPANVMMTANGQPLIMDFGIARSIKQHTAQTTIDGSPHYIAPEIILGKGVTPLADIFSLGMVLYELITGRPVAESDDVHQILLDTLKKTAEPPSARNLKVDDRLEPIVMKAMAKKSEDRYADARQMQLALENYLSASDAKPAHESDAKHTTLDFLLRRMRSKSDFPLLSSTLSEINRVVDDDSASTALLTKVILQDFSLTNKLLRQVNTATYGQFGGKINTISKAVVILGFETVRNLAMNLILFEFLQNKAQAAQLKDEVLSSFFAGLVAAQFSLGKNIKDAEEAMICSMFRNLGKLLSTFYFFEESQEVSRLVEQGDTEDRAAVKVLGMTYNDLGVGIARSWNFPPRLLAGMQKLGGDKIAKPYGELESLAVTVNLANELCDIVAKASCEEKSKLLKQLIGRYQEAMPLTEPQLQEAIKKGLEELASRAAAASINLTNSTLMKSIRQCAAGMGEPLPAKTSPASNSMTGLSQLGVDFDAGEQDRGTKENAETILSAGIQDVTNTLVEEFQLNGIMQMVLETMHRGMGFLRTVIFIRDAKTNQMEARFGFGEAAEFVVPKFRFSMMAAPDVFYIAISKGVDLQIEDISAENIASKIPKWYREAVSSQSFILLPIMIKDKPIGLFYADMQEANSMKVTPRQLSLLRTLRNQAVLAIKQKM